MRKDNKDINWKRHGGKIPYLMKTYSGVRQFVIDKLIDGNHTQKKFKKELENNFPNIPKKYLPSIRTISNFQNNWEKHLKVQSKEAIEVAMRNKEEVFQAVKDFNIIEEQLKLFKRVSNTLDQLEETMEEIDKNRSDDGLPTLIEHMDEYIKLLDKKCKMLEKLDDLCIRYGIMPPRDIKNNPEQFNTTFNQQKSSEKQISHDQLEIRLRQIIASISHKERNDKRLAEREVADESQLD